MKITATAVGLSLAIAIAAPANAQQYGTTAKQQAPQQPAAPAEAPAKEEYSPKISSGAAKAIMELQTAVNANDAAAYPEKLAAAQAKAKSKDDKYVIARLELQHASAQKDLDAMVKAIEEVIASGAVPATTVEELYTNIGKLQYNNKAFDKAATIFERVLQIDPNNKDSLFLLAESRAKQGRAAEGLALAKRGLAAASANGAKPDESVYRFVFAIAQNNDLPSAPDEGLALVAAYPTSQNWRDLLRSYQGSSKLENEQLLDVMRLQYVTHALVSESDYYRLANTLYLKGFPGEAKAVLDSGFAAGHINKTSPSFSELYKVASTKSQGDRASLAASAKTAAAAATGKPALATGDAYLGYGDYKEAIDQYRVALTKPGVDKDVVNLHVGMALALSGDKAGAKAALDQVGGTQAETAKFWKTYVSAMA